MIWPLTKAPLSSTVWAVRVVASPKNPGDEIKTCIKPYVVTEADAVGSFINNEVKAIAEKGTGAFFEVTENLELEFIPKVACTSDQWTSSIEYKSPDIVFYCSSPTFCNEWIAQQTTEFTGEVPGGLANPPYWTKVTGCNLENSCQVYFDMTTVPMSNNSTSQGLKIFNSSGVSVEIGYIQLSWVDTNKNNPASLSKVSLNGIDKYTGLPSMLNGGYIPSTPWALEQGSTIIPLDFSFTEATKSAQAVITFTDELCSPLTLNSGN